MPLPRLQTPLSQAPAPGGGGSIRGSRPGTSGSVNYAPHSATAAVSPPASAASSRCVANAGRSQSTPTLRRPPPEARLPLVEEEIQGSAAPAPEAEVERRPTLAETLARMKKVKKDHAAHLRLHPVQMGLPMTLTSTYTAGTLQPVQKASDPKWSSELRALDVKIGQKFRYDNRLTASVSGSISPEPMHFPKPYTMDS
mmetsp:Transcript_95400/g.274737  ORF Transcript_95400/g.274737 Transcript_95400/m.274737 type:complete len:198 (-) Transcript_95400:53-646(-)|eukprot:CAMPEP_0170242402 /NCGR_PEP_ID=MMETSP0116_2-20130129/20972_1 /TAXON_ID=400756 /ORGANISM="Durinskia baltica, Strain CSIRO CS-38" /LENGTH=197 /DNA_ID=CAMNT_0010493247 /DNA_START=45 /DNA_END=638 /DNA_ORIENTATION=-